jgi:hypothetical protein
LQTMNLQNRILRYGLGQIFGSAKH